MRLAAQALGRWQITEERMDNAIEITREETDTKVDLSRIYAAPGARLGCLAFEGQGAFPSQC